VIARRFASPVCSKTGFITVVVGPTAVMEIGIEEPLSPFERVAVTASAVARVSPPAQKLQDSSSGGGGGQKNGARSPSRSRLEKPPDTIAQNPGQTEVNVATLPDGATE
jgi:hypothetical protein